MAKQPCNESGQGPGPRGPKGTKPFHKAISRRPTFSFFPFGQDVATEQSEQIKD